MQKPILLFSVLAFILVGCSGTVQKTPAPPPSPVKEVIFPSGLQVFFSHPADTHASDYEGGPDEALAAAIDQARFSVDMAAYTLNLWSIRDALIHAHQRGVTVRLVMESDNMDNPEVLQIRATGIPVLGDQREGLMHNKFMVIDRAEVWTGSMNFSIGAAYYDNNNLIRIRSEQAAEIYTRVFNEMFEEGKFGPFSRTQKASPDLKIEGISLSIYFSPEDGIATHLLDLIRNAQKSIYFLAYSFTSDSLADAILEQSARGVIVSGVMDAAQINQNQGGEYDHFMQKRLDVRKDGNQGLMHHKVIIIDEKIVVTGSYNFTASAEKNNDENVVILTCPPLAEKYLEEFRQIYAQGIP